MELYLPTINNKGAVFFWKISIFSLTIMACWCIINSMTELTKSAKIVDRIYFMEYPVLVNHEDEDPNESPMIKSFFLVLKELGEDGTFCLQACDGEEIHVFVDAGIISEVELAVY